MGKDVKKVKVGDHVGVGVVVDSCLNCDSCKEGEENYCENGRTSAYDVKITHGHLKTNSGYTFGGYSKRMTLREDFIIKVPEGYPLETAGPVFCAGITMFSPLNYWGANKGGKRVGIVGVGGLGQVSLMEVLCQKMNEK